MKITHKNLDRVLIFMGIFWLFTGYFFVSSEFRAMAAGNTYYVAETGCSDSGPGTAGEPWCAIAKAASTLQAGDTVLVQDGTYIVSQINPTYSGISGSPITFKANGDNVILDGSGTHAFWLRNRNYVTLDGFEFINSEACVMVYPSSSTMTGITLKNFYSNAGCRIGIYTSDFEYGLEDYLVENIHFISAGGIGMNGANGGILRNCLLDCTATAGSGGCNTGINNGNNILIENNQFLFVNEHTINIGHSDPAKGCTNVVVRNNLFYRIHDVKIDAGNDNVDVLHNTFVLEKDAGWSSINNPEVYPSTDITVKDNLFVQTGWTHIPLSRLSESDHNYWVSGWPDSSSAVIYGNLLLADWQAASGNIHDLNSHQDLGLDRYNIFVDPDNYDFTPQANSWLCQDGNEGSDGETIGALSCAGGGAAAVCSDGEITETCDCGGTDYDTGYCCAGVYQDSDCSVDDISIIHSPEYVAHSTETASINLTVTTNYLSTCKYDTNSGTDYASMPNTMTGSDTSHTATLSGLESGTTYNYYVRCSTSFGTTENDHEIVYRVLPEYDDQYPRLGLVLHGCIIEDAATVEQAARYDLLVLHKYHTEYEGRYCNPDRLEEIRALSPRTKMFVHQPQSYAYHPLETWPGDGSYPAAGHILYDWLDGVVHYGDPEDRWTLTDTAGDTIWELSNTSWDVAVMDITPYCPVADGTVDYNYNSNNVDYTKETLIDPGIWDGVFWDSLYNNINWMNSSIEPDIDIDHDGVADTNDFSTAQWTAGINDFYSKARNYMGEDIWFIGNGNHDQYQYGNGEMIEGWWSNRTWRERIDAFDNWNSNGQEPDFNMVVGPYNSEEMPATHNYRVPRWAFTFSLLTGSYYEMFDDEVGYTEFYWLDEYAVDLTSGEAVIPTEANDWLGKNYLGEAEDDAYELDVNPTSYPQGVWRRDFANGIVLANPNSPSVTIDLGGEYRKILGTQDPINDGSTVSQITLTGSNGIILLKPACEEDWQCTDWSDCEDSQQTRTCTDLNVCGTEIDKPEETRYCDSISPEDIDDLIAD
ncbi:MAG: putative glycoside hydrolase [Patescibacteria group bacterium]